MPRSYLYVPGDAERRLARARERGADAVIIDLEDAVAAGSRPDARRRTHAALTATAPSTGPAAPVPPGGAARGQVWVRVNPPPEMAADIEAVAVPGLSVVVVAKADPDTLAEADRLLAAAEADRGLPPGGLAVIALIETATGLLRAPDAARAPRVVRLGLGEADLIGELRLLPGADRSELAGLRLQVVLASAAAGLAAPVGPVETDLGDDRRLRSSTRVLRSLGFRARTALHPRQVPVINEAFTPSATEVERARRTVAALAEADARGSAVAATADDDFVDPAVARSAYETLSAYEHAMRHNDQTRVQR